MKKKYRLSTALDIDDLLMECVPYAIRLANEKYDFDPPLSIYEIDRWGKLGTRADVIFEFFADPEFYKNQPIIKGAKEFVRKLSEMTEVYISTSVYPEFMTLRAKRIIEEFPEIPADHIYMGSRKDKIDVDILFDDGMHNIFESNAAYPILMRRPWNSAATGVLAVNTYDEFLKLVEIIMDSYSVSSEKFSPDTPGVVVLIGPTGSGKNDVAKEMLNRYDCFRKLVSYTTAEPSESECGGDYHHVTLDEFRAMAEGGELFESTNYANHFYGSRKADVEAILAAGKHVLTVMDICGAMALKTHFPNVITVYIKRDKRELLSSIIDRDAKTEDKVDRIMAIEAEKHNAEICDYVVRNDGVIGTAERIYKGLHDVK